MISFDILWCLLISCEIFWYPMISFDILIYFLIYDAIFWFLLISYDILDIFWFLMISYDIFWYLVVSYVIFFDVLIFSNRTRIQNSHSDVSKAWVYIDLLWSSWRNCSLFSILCWANSCQASSVHKNSCTAQSRRWTSRSTGRMGFTTRCAWRGQCVASCVALSALVSLMSHIHSRFKRVMTYTILMDLMARVAWA